MNDNILTSNKKVGCLLMWGGFLLPILAYADFAEDYGKNIMLALSIIIVMTLITGVIILARHNKISKWLMWLTIISDIILLVCNVIIYCSTGYTYSEFLGRDMFWVNVKTIYISLIVSFVVVLISYFIYKRKLGKDSEL